MSINKDYDKYSACPSLAVGPCPWFANGKIHVNFLTIFFVLITRADKQPVEVSARSLLLVPVGDELRFRLRSSFVSRRDCPDKPVSQT